MSDNTEVLADELIAELPAPTEPEQGLDVDSARLYRGSGVLAILDLESAYDFSRARFVFERPTPLLNDEGKTIGWASPVVADSGHDMRMVTFFSMQYSTPRAPAPGDRRAPVLAAGRRHRDQGPGLGLARESGPTGLEVAGNRG